MCSVYKWVANYLADGLPALEAKSRRTALPFVYKTAETTDDYIDQQRRSAQGGGLTGETI